MVYRLLADLTLMLHLAFILFVLLGGFLCLYRTTLIWLHLPAVFWAILIEWQGLICPLTHLENHFHRLAADDGFEGSFIEHYLIPVIYPEDLTYSIQFLLGLIVIVVNLGIYLFVLYRKKKLKPIVD